MNARFRRVSFRETKTRSKPSKSLISLIAVSKPYPQELVCLQGLEELNVSKNKFQGVVPRVICELKNLKTLILGGCGLNDLPDEFAKLQGLERLELWGNKFEKVPKALSSLKISKYFL